MKSRAKPTPSPGLVNYAPEPGTPRATGQFSQFSIVTDGASHGGVQPLSGALPQRRSRPAWQ